ncbi:MAG: hypothetical protein IE931_07550 [Sphingobacteriales bacterium]|nr:hypothetical protein [Sphingobacteriales bacterium]
MKLGLKYVLLVFLFALGFYATSQESTKAKDFDLPPNTVKAVINYADFTIPQQQFSMRPNHSTYTFQDEKIINFQYRDSTTMVKTALDYHYENGQLKSKETLQSYRAGTKYKTNKYQTENKGYKTTFYRTYPTGETDKTILFYNDAGELRGKSIYNSLGKRTQQIEYGGKEGYRVKKYHNEKLMSTITYYNNSEGKLMKTEASVLPGEKDEIKVLTLFYYNLKGDLRQMVDFITETKNSGQKQSKIKHINYLYDGDLWVAKIEYSQANSKTKKLVATVRSIQTTEKIYQAPSQVQLKAFCQETYQKYLKL